MKRWELRALLRVRGSEAVEKAGRIWVGLEPQAEKRTGMRETQRLITEKCITVKVQYCVLSFRNETREVEWIEVVGGNLGVW